MQASMPTSTKPLDDKRLHVLLDTNPNVTSERPLPLQACVVTLRRFLLYVKHACKCWSLSTEYCQKTSESTGTNMLHVWCKCYSFTGIFSVEKVEFHRIDPFIKAVEEIKHVQYLILFLFFHYCEKSLSRHSHVCVLCSIFISVQTWAHFFLPNLVIKFWEFFHTNPKLLITKVTDKPIFVLTLHTSSQNSVIFRLLCSLAPFACVKSRLLTPEASPLWLEGSQQICWWKRIHGYSLRGLRMHALESFSPSDLYPSVACSARSRFSLWLDLRLWRLLRW